MAIVDTMISPPTTNPKHNQPIHQSETQHNFPNPPNKRKYYDHVPFLPPKYPTSGIAFHATPSPSAVSKYTVFPHQRGNTAPGYEMQKKMTMPLSARPVSSAAARM